MAYAGQVTLYRPGTENYSPDEEIMIDFTVAGKYQPPHYDKLYGWSPAEWPELELDAPKGIGLTREEESDLLSRAWDKWERERKDDK